MSFIAGLWTVEAHLNAAVVSNNSSARIWANTSLVMSSQLPRNISSYSHIYYRTDDVHFVTLNQLLFRKVRKSQSKTLLGHLQPMMLTYLVFTSTHLSPGWKIASGNFHWPVLELQLLLFWGGFFFVWMEDLFPMPDDRHHYIGFGSPPPTHPFVGCILVYIKVY